MSKRKLFTAAQASTSTYNITQNLKRVKIEDDEEYEVPTIDLTGLDDDQEGVDIIREVTPVNNQNAGELPFGCELRSSADLDGTTVLPGDSLEFNDGHFLHDIRIFYDFTKNRTTVDGNLLKRMGRLDDGLKGMLSTNRVNELCLVLRAPSARKDPTLAECRRLRNLEDAICKRAIILTNKRFPAYSVYEFLDPTIGSMPEIRREAQLVCRWRCTEETITAGRKIYAGSLMMLREEECDESVRASDICLLKMFLKEKKKEEKPKPKPKPRSHDEAVGADERELISLVDDEQVEEHVIEVSKSSLSKKRPHTFVDNMIDLTADSGDEDVQITKRRVFETIKRLSSAGECITKRQTSSKTVETTRKKPSMTAAFPVRKQSSSTNIFSPQSSHAHPQPRPKKTYYAPRRQGFTFGDLCTGGGGTASGAWQAGFKLNFLLDHWDVACNTLRENFKRACKHILLQSIFDFCTSDWEVDYVDVDVLHISFPCQPHSPLHTVEGRNDSDNIATGYSVIPILQKCKPRIVTFEQTSGIVTHNGGFHFRALIRQITDSGYSLRWKICNLAEYGNVQPRKRLIIIAACPGETLPPFPEPTHGIGPGKLPFVTVHDVLRSIRHVHVPHHMRDFTRKDVQPYDARKPLQHCIACDGSNAHPSGKRTFSLFELAALQGFPPTHQFTGNKTEIRRQIGNAVPSMFAKALFQRITQSLEESDARIAAWKPVEITLD